MTMRPLDPNNPIAAMMPHGMIVDLPQQKKSGGMFGGGGIGQAIAGMIGDYLLQRSGMKPMYTPLLQERQKMMLEQQVYDRKRQDTMADWVQQQQWKLDHDKPDYGELGNRMIQAGIQPGSQQWVANMAAAVENTVDPVVNTMTMGPVLRSMVTQGMRPPTQPVGSLTPIPDDGGPTPPASGGFLGY